MRRGTWPPLRRSLLPLSPAPEQEEEPSGCPRCGRADALSSGPETHGTGVTGPDGHGEERITEDVARCGACGWIGDPGDIVG